MAKIIRVFLNTHCLMKNDTLIFQGKKNGTLAVE